MQPRDPSQRIDQLPGAIESQNPMQNGLPQNYPSQITQASDQQYAARASDTAPISWHQNNQYQNLQQQQQQQQQTQGSQQNQQLPPDAGQVQQVQQPQQAQQIEQVQRAQRVQQAQQAQQIMSSPERPCYPPTSTTRPIYHKSTQSCTSLPYMHKVQSEQPTSNEHYRSYSVCYSPYNGHKRSRRAFGSLQLDQVASTSHGRGPNVGLESPVKLGSEADDVDLVSHAPEVFDTQNDSTIDSDVTWRNTNAPFEETETSFINRSSLTSTTPSLSIGSTAPSSASSGGMSPAQGEGYRRKRRRQDLVYTPYVRPANGSNLPRPMSISFSRHGSGSSYSRSNSLSRRASTGYSRPAIPGPAQKRFSLMKRSSFLTRNVPQSISSASSSVYSFSGFPNSKNNEAGSNNGEIGTNTSTAGTTITSANTANNSSSITKKQTDSRKELSSSPSIPGDTQTSILELARGEVNKSSFEQLAEKVHETAKLLNDRAKPKRGGKHTVKHIQTQVKRLQQIFALVVLLRFVCAKKTSVCPRNRVYNKYAMICQNNGLLPMCNASFGKLVRLCFPNVKTRRLGVRGTSRYHYCGLKLLDEDEDALDSVVVSRTNSVLGTPISSRSVLSSSPSSSEISSHFGDEGIATTTANLPQNKPLCLDVDILSFFTSKVPQFQPSASQYLTEIGIDNTYAGYKEFNEFACKYTSFSSAIFQNLRFMKIKTLFGQLNSFGSGEYALSTRVRAFLEDPRNHKAVCAFISRCDCELYLYSSMLLSKVIFQNAPSAVRGQISKLDSRLLTGVNHMALPDYIKEKKKEHLRNFVHLIFKLSRVIDSGALVASKFSNPLKRSRLLDNWKKIDMKKVLDEDPSLSNTLKQRDFIILHRDYTQLFIRLLQLDNHSISGSTDQKKLTNSVIQIVSNFLMTLPQKFSSVDPQTFLIRANSLLATITREVSHISFSHSDFSDWWSFGCWEVEFLSFIALLGGYMKKYESFLQANKAKQS